MRQTFAPVGLDRHHPGRVITGHPARAYGGPMATTAPPLSDDRLGEMLSLMQDSDSVELKLTVPESAQRSAVMALGMDPLAAQVRLIYFFDTPDLALERSGLVVRARRVNRGDDSVVKLRPVVPSELSDEVRASPFCMVEVDAMPGGHVCSASLQGRPKTPAHEVV